MCKIYNSLNVFINCHSHLIDCVEVLLNSLLIKDLLFSLRGRHLYFAARDKFNSENLFNEKSKTCREMIYGEISLLFV